MGNVYNNDNAMVMILVMVMMMMMMIVMMFPLRTKFIPAVWLFVDHLFTESCISDNINNNNNI